MIYKKKYMWTAVELEEEIKKVAQRAREMTGMPITSSDIGFKLANDLKNGNIKLFVPTLKRKRQMFIKLGDEYVKRKQKR